MTAAVYCSCESESQANAVLTHLRNSRFSLEISVFLQDRSDTKDISLKENAVRGIEIGGIAGAIISLVVPPLGVPWSIAALLAASNGAAAGGVIGGLLGGTGALKPLGLPDEVARNLQHQIGEGNILIGVRSDDPVALERALAIYKSEGIDFVFDSRDKAA